MILNGRRSSTSTPRDIYIAFDSHMHALIGG